LTVPFVTEDSRVSALLKERLMTVAGPTVRPYTIPAVDAYDFNSQTLDREFEISVAVLAQPPADQRYPVVYVTDANFCFAWLTQAAQMMQLGKQLPELILVGIGYPLDALLVDPAAAQQWVGLRRQDMSPARHEQGWGGGAGEFLRFLDEELMPFINSKYPVNVDDSTIVGDSLGAVFALYTLFTKPNMFKRYLAGSPAISFTSNGDLLNSLEEKLSESSPEFSAKLFMGAGGLEGDEMLSDVSNMETRLRRYPGLEVSTKVFEGETHFSVPGFQYSYGLRTIFQESSPANQS
jgi:predicted alpha/beta superfamily hydrolase